jgi:hypothetical protein
MASLRARLKSPKSSSLDPYLSLKPGQISLYSTLPNRVSPVAALSRRLTDLGNLTFGDLSGCATSW